MLLDIDSCLMNVIVTKHVFPQSQPGRVLHSLVVEGEIMLSAEVKSQFDLTVTLSFSVLC